MVLLIIYLISSNFNAVTPSCKETVLIGWKTLDDMTEMDSLSYKSAKKRCPEKFPRSPCLKIFAKKHEGNYVAICGGYSK